MKDFMKSVISKSIIGQNEVHVGVMQFSTVQQLQFPLNRYHSKDEMSKAIDDMQQLGGGTHTGGAITDVSQYFDASKGGRPGLRQRLIVITDGEAQDEVKDPAAALRAKGVVIYAIGVVDANTTQLLEISGSPDRMYAERDFDALKDLESQVALELCDPERGKNRLGLSRNTESFQSMTACKPQIPFLQFLKSYFYFTSQKLFEELHWRSK